MENILPNLIDWHRILPQAVKMILAFVIALPIALDREKTTRIMGVRTYPLVALASCGYILISLNIIGSNAEAKARILQGLITGIGFIGGGAILKTDSRVMGTATAASIWCTGAVGASIAFGHLDIAILVAILTFLVLRFFTPLKGDIDKEDGAIP